MKAKVTINNNRIEQIKISFTVGFSRAPTETGTYNINHRRSIMYKGKIEHKRHRKYKETI
jgi:hypothetical protein